MKHIRLVAWVCLVGLVCPVVGSSQLHTTNGIIDVIDIRPIIARHAVSNSLGLAFNPDLNVLYVAHGASPLGGFIYTLDLHGKLLDEIDFQLAYRSGAYPTSLSYDPATKHLYIVVYGSTSPELVEFDPASRTALRSWTIDSLGGGGAIKVTDDGFWQSRFAEDIIRRYSTDGTFLQDVSVASSFPGASGPGGLTPSVAGGFFVVDHSGRRIVEVDRTGREMAVLSTAALGDGRGLAIDSHAASQRIFLQVDNEDIFILSSEFLGLSVSVDVRPGRFPNTVNPEDRGQIPVAILTTGPIDNTISFRANTVNPETVRFGSHGTEAKPVQVRFRDINGDRDLDMVLYFNVQDTGIQCDDRSVNLIGTTLSGQRIQGVNSITTPDCP